MCSEGQKCSNKSDSGWAKSSEYPRSSLVGYVEVVDCLPQSSLVAAQQLLATRKQASESGPSNVTNQEDGDIPVGEEILACIPPEERNTSPFVTISKNFVALPYPLRVSGQRRLCMQSGFFLS